MLYPIPLQHSNHAHIDPWEHASLPIHHDILASAKPSYFGLQTSRKHTSCTDLYVIENSIYMSRPHYEYQVKQTNVRQSNLAWSQSLTMSVDWPYPLTMQYHMESMYILTICTEIVISFAAQNPTQLMQCLMWYFSDSAFWGWGWGRGESQQSPPDKGMNALLSGVSLWA